MKKEFLESGRRTRFAPKRVAERETITRGRESQPVTDPEVTKAQADGARELMGNSVFQGIVTALVDEATEEFYNSPIGSTGQLVRDTAHAQIKALDAIVSRMEAMAEDARLYEAREAQEAAERHDTEQGEDSLSA